MLGAYPARQASANFGPSTATPLFLATATTSCAIPERQSTTVPKVSKTSALIDAGSIFVTTAAALSLKTFTSRDISVEAAAAAEPRRRKSRRETTCDVRVIDQFLDRSDVAEGMRSDQGVSHDAAADEMLLDDLFEHGRIAASVPRTFWIHDCNRTAFADAQAIGFGAQNATLLREAKLLQAALQEFPGREPALLLTTLGIRLIAAEKDVAAGGGNTNRGGNGAL